MLEMLVSNVDVEETDYEKKIENYSAPPPIKAVVEAMARAELDGKSKWVVYSAAVVLLNRLTPEERGDLFDQVRSADRRRDYGELLTPDVAEGGEGGTVTPTPAKGKAPGKPAANGKRGR